MQRLWSDSCQVMFSKDNELFEMEIVLKRRQKLLKHLPQNVPLHLPPSSVLLLGLYILNVIHPSRPLPLGYEGGNCELNRHLSSLRLSYFKDLGNCFEELITHSKSIHL